MTDSNTNPYAGSGQSPWQPEQAPAPSSESDSGAANPSGEAGSIVRLIISVRSRALVPCGAKDSRSQSIVMVRGQHDF